MAKNKTSEVHRVARIGAHVEAPKQSLMKRGQAVVNHLPEAVDGAIVFA